MALVNPNIAMSYRAPEIQQPNMLADYAAIQQIQGGRQAQELNALKMQEAQAAMQERNALRQLNPTAADYEAQLFRVNPTLGIAYRKERSAADASAAQIAASQAAAAKSGFDLKAAQRKFGEDLKRGLSANPSDANIIAFGEDAVLQGLYTPEQVKGTVDQLLALPAADRVRILSQAGATAGELRPVAVGSSLMTTQGQLLATAPRQSQLLTPEEEAQKARIALAGRPPAQPVAPTITSIVNPVNPNEMITIDARRYQGGGAGSPGVIGVAGKEPGAALRQNKTEAGKTRLADDLDNLRSSFAELDRLRAIPSTGRGVVSNLMSAAQSSGVGQALGRAGGTPEQVERDVINSARLRLVSSIKNATGMSSKSLDSNVELQTMLRSLSDPSQSVDAALRIIDDIENAYVKGDGKMLKRKPPPAAAGVDTSNPLLQVSP
jgi:hypothetical protein